MTTRSLGYLLAVFGSALATGCATSSPGAEKEAKPADLESLKTVGGKANGLIVWTSSRTGRPHLFTMRTDGTDAKEITRGPTTDWNPRFSPDGTKILFARSRERAFVRESQANDDEAWDLYTVSVDGESLDKVVENATWGSWIGPDEILFLRGSKILRTKLGSSEEAKIMDTARYPFFAGAIVQRPELSPDGHLLALTLAGRYFQTGLWNIKKKTWTQIGMGAQIAWAPDGASVYWVEAAGNGLSRIVHEPVTNGAPPAKVDPADIVLVDLKGKRTRELFPRFSNDGRWLVFGSAIKSLENDLEDFEIYLWEAGSASHSATRMTFHSANDRWPDLFVGEPGKVTTPKAETNDDEKRPDETRPDEKRPDDKRSDETRSGDAADARAPEATEPASKPAAKPAVKAAAKPERAASEGDEGSPGQADDWDDAPKKAAPKKALKEDAPEAAPASADEDTAPAEAEPTKTAPAAKKKHKKKRR